jgi:hypothetical protein
MEEILGVNHVRDEKLFQAQTLESKRRSGYGIRNTDGVKIHARCEKRGTG